MTDNSTHSASLSNEHARLFQELGITHIGFERGFPEHIGLPARRFLESAEALFAAAPVTSLSLASVACVQAIAASPHLARLTHLYLGWNEIGDEGIRELAASPHLANLTELSLDHNCIGDKGVRTLARSPHLTNLRYLNLEANRISDKGVRALTASPHLANLTEVSLANNHRIGGQLLEQIEREMERRRTATGQGA